MFKFPHTYLKPFILVQVGDLKFINMSSYFQHSLVRKMKSKEKNCQKMNSVGIKAYTRVIIIITKDLH